MLKKILLFIVSAFFIACSNNETRKTTTQIENKPEIIRLIITTDQASYLLGDNFDYEFKGEEARKLSTLLDFYNIEGLTQENVKQIRKEIEVNEEGDVKFWISTDFTFLKEKKDEPNNTEFEKNQEVLVEKIRTKLKEKNIEFSLKETSEEWSFSLPNAIKLNGKATKLINHNEILEKSKEQMIEFNINLKISTEVPINKESFASRAGNKVKETAGNVVAGAIGVALIPVAVVFSVAMVPIFLLAMIE